MPRSVVPGSTKLASLWKTAVAFGTYALLSVLLFGRDVVLDPTDRVVGDDLADKTLYMWSLEWWPFALLNGKNPLDVDSAWAPHGFDLGLGTAGGGLSIVAAPLTLVSGPVATYNVLILLAPALAGTTAFVLGHHLTRQFLPALVGGYVFGFSSYELGHLIGHLPLAFVALIPLAAYLIVLRQEGSLSPRAFVFGLAAVLTGQFLIVPQVFFVLLLVGCVVALLAVCILGPSVVRRTVGESAVAAATALLVVSPILLYAVISDAAPPGRSPFAGAADVLNYVVPTPRTWLLPPGSDAIAGRFTGVGAEQGAYLGLPLIALGVLAVLRRPSRPRWFLAAVLVAVAVLSLGTRIKVAGEVIGIGPWQAVAVIPIAGSALPMRLTVYVALFMSILVAFALADRVSVTRWLLAALGVAAILPNLTLDRWSSEVPRPAFFTSQAAERNVPAGSTALILPYGPSGWSMLWHAEADFRFRMIGGHFALRVTPSEEEWRDVYESLGTGNVSPERLRAFLEDHRVDVAIVVPGARPEARFALAQAVRQPPVSARDALVYRLRERDLLGGP